MNRLTAAAYPGVSNRLKAIHTGTLTGAVEKSFTYDDEGRLITQTGVGAKTLSWDQKGRAKTISANARTVSYQYDPLDYRIGSYGASTGNADYYLEGEYVEAIYSGNRLQAEYLRGTSPDELVAGWSFDAAGSWKPAIYHHDNVMSVTGISAHTGAVQEQIAYGAFGNVLNDTGTTTNQLRYTGREADTDTGLYYYRARYYDNSIGRFVSEDPLGFKAGMNFYAYVNNNPVNGNDPSGKCPACVVAFVDVAIDLAGSAAVRNGVTAAINAARTAMLTGTIGGASGALGSLSAGGNAQDVAINAGVGFVTGAAFPLLPGTSFLANAGKGALLSGTGDAISQSISLGMANKSIYQNINFGEIGGATIGGGVASGLTASFGKSFGEQVSAGIVGFGPSTAAQAVGQALGASPSAPLQGGFGGPPSTNTFAAGAAGGFLIYPNKSNTNQIQSVYAK